MTKSVILTGLRANNDLTLGNYFGGILPMVEMVHAHKSEYQINMFIPDLHSFTTPIDHSELYGQVLHAAAVFTAAGMPLEAEDIYMYRQSFVPAHSELTWILDNFTGMGQMSRMTQFKDKSAGKDDVSLGLFNYPVLMAADILLYGAKYIPVGEDQAQHIEFTRDIAERMNARFGTLFVVPEAVKKQYEFFGKEQGLRVMDLVDPTKKMSKSDESGKGVIFLNDEPGEAAKKIMNATTDNLANVQFNRQDQPGISNLLEILSLVRGASINETASHFAGITRYGDFKTVVAREVSQLLTSFQENLAAVDASAVEANLRRSEQAMNVQANARLLSVQQAVGLRPKAIV